MQETQITEPTRRLSNRICDAIVLLFAAWTLVCNVCVACGATLFQLIAASVLMAILATIGAILVFRFRGGPENRPPAKAEQRGNADISGGKTLRCLIPSLAAAILVIACIRGGYDLLAWWIMLGHFVLLALLRWKPVASISLPNSNANHEAATWILAAICALIALCAHKPSADDCFYINLSVGAADNAAQPLLKWDTMHGVADTPILLPAYRVHSLELMMAALSYLSGIEAINLFHLLIPAVGGLFCCLAWARLLRLLLPSVWIWVLIAVISIYLCVGGPPQWFSYFSLVRLYQGKSLMVCACIPLLIAYAVEYMCRPSLRAWILLAACQVAAIGFSSTALWLAPTIVGLTALSVMPLSGQVPWKTLLGVIASSAYILAAGLVFVILLKTQAELPGLRAAPDRPLMALIDLVLGKGLLRDACLATILLAWFFCPTALSERFCIFYPLCALLTVLNPYLAKTLIENVVGGPTYWRTIWVLPVPLFLAIAVSAPMIAWQKGRFRWLRTLGYFLGITILAVFIAPYSPFSRENHGAEIHWPGKKVPPEYAIAAQIVRLVPRQACVLAPISVSTWIPTFHHHPSPLVTREHYMFLLDAANPGESGRRLALEAYISGWKRTENSPKQFIEALHDLSLQLVCVNRSCNWLAEIRTALDSAGFTHSYEDKQYEIWVRNPK
jgi:hypothetical protein